MIDPTIGVVLVALSTVNTAVMIGLGFFRRPSRASAIWSIAFILAMVTSYGWVAADVTGSPTLRAGCAGGLLGATLLVWSGVRAWRGKRPFVGVAAGVTAVFCIALPLAAGNDVFGLVFRVVFAVGAAFAALTLAELVKIGPHLRHETMPLALASSGFILFGTLSVVDAVLQGPPAAGSDGLDLIRNLNSMGSIVYGTAALITVLLLTREGAPTQRAPKTASPFRAVAEDRLRRAEALGDKWWCLLDIRLDDPVDLREAFSATDFARVADRFARDVRAVLPADADIVSQDAAHITVLLPRPEGAVRQLLSRLLDRVATPDPAQPIAVRVSASIGWAGVDVVGYDLDELLAAARLAGAEAQRSGGDRWERVSAAQHSPR
ncbi:hypothetical protein NQ156_10580 [Microbacterium sp. zg.Y625]|uniref:hypothetical protein n=1 Tax=Microbacterium jiangjiandongii TaxID=3049071 RepID=UPI00214B8F56|nr:MULTISPECIES: hypothetical protein [unclassified Microbacterium]MCR2793506.1 hypothetical protein [Microbacterium sp. zg.Y625]WIM25860.1 hypothetical protein QNO14_02065 [Microbacterium sp. zg-Y625]